MPAIAEIVLAGLLCTILVAAMYIQEAKRYPFVQLSVLLSFGLTMALVVINRDAEALALGDLYVLDSFAVVFKLLILLAGFFALLMGSDYIKLVGFNRFEYPILAGFAVLGMMMMLSAHDLMSLYIGLELQSLSLYVLAAMRRDSLYATEAGLKYFVLGALASCLLLYGSSLVYGFIGATDYSAIAASIIEMKAGNAEISKGAIVGLVIVLIAVGFKLSAVPFHMWTPDVYEGAPTSVTAFFASAPKIAAFGLVLRLAGEPFGEMMVEWQQVIIALSALSMILGALAGLVQSNLKRLMAYSSIGHVGFALMGMAAGGQDGFIAVGVYLMIYLFTVIGTFACILAMRRGDTPVDSLNDLAGIGKTHHLLGICLMLFMFSMAGIPPLAGFFAKYYVFVAAIDSNLVWLAVIGALSSVVSAFYYIRIIKIIYFEETDKPLELNIAPMVKLVMIISLIMAVGFVFYPSFITLPAEFAAQGLF
ncbi:MAG: NADH-quinone oxidoreductase subunit NuoN [Alphaproteobacteria bacterium]